MKNKNFGPTSSLTHAPKANITTDVAHITPEGQSTATSSLGNTMRTGAAALLVALTPSTSTLVTAGAAGVVATTTMSCEKDALDPNAIDRSTDNPAHMAEFMKDVKSVTVGAITTNYNAIWDGSGYQLIPKSHEINAENAISWMESRGLTILTFGFSNNSNVRISWAIPISALRSTETIDLMNNTYDSFMLNTDLSKGEKSTPLTKGQQGTLYVRGYKNPDSERVDWQIINPYYIGK